MAVQLALTFEEKRKLNEQFSLGLQKLNQSQRAAVEEIEGPVLVIAGPGTGKTEILSLRIGNILKNTDCNPANILCLTYTESGTIAMRKRLLKYIGPAAYNVHIFTFHAFCNQIIQENRNEFGFFRDLRPVTELELIDIFRELIDTIPDDHPLKRLVGNRYFDLKRFQWLFDNLKRENTSIEALEEAIEKKLDLLKEDPDYVLKRASKNGEIGDLNYKGRKKKEKYYTTLQAAKFVSTYNQLLKKAERYDYNDMILWVLNKFTTNESLLAYYQEKYQYILVDEYQDTNGAQNEILYKICDYWENPNVFAVGDDDQAIFRFQGANMANIIEFINKYNPEVIMLTHNYRSTQQVLNWSGKLIEENSDRLVHHHPELNKTLIASSGHAHSSIEPMILRYQNTAQEESDIMRKILDLQTQGVALSEIAVIYRNHKQVDNLVQVLERKGVPINIRRKVNILQIPIILNLINILHYVQTEYTDPHSAEYRLFEIMHYPYFQIPPTDVAHIALAARSRRGEVKKHWRNLISNRAKLIELEIKSVDEVLALDENISRWVGHLSSITMQVLFERILKHGNVLKYILQSEDKIWQLQVVNTFFEFIKEETAKNPLLSLKEFLEMIDKMQEHDIALNLNKITYSEEGVHMMTAHGAKGLEFDYVFIMGVTQSIWSGKSRKGLDSFELPFEEDTSSGMQIQDERRLFYVAMTRARKHLVITTSSIADNGNDQEPAQFIEELCQKLEIEPKLTITEEDDIISFYLQVLTPEDKQIELVDRSWIDFILQDLRISATALNKYLRCPLTFYFENILRIPSARTEYLGFGSAVHTTLEEFFRKYQIKGSRPVKTVLIELFEKSMHDYQSHFTEKEFSDRMIFGKDVMGRYYDNYKELWGHEKKLWLEERFTHVECEGVPISGVLDKVEEYKDYVVVVDYKTGKVENARRLKKIDEPKDEDDPGGDYWRQIVFYKILIDQDPTKNWDMKKGYMDFVQPNNKNEFFRKKYLVTPEEITKVKDQLVQAYQGIQNYEFERGCQDEHCYWCNFVKYHFDASILNEEDIYIYD